MTEYIHVGKIVATFGLQGEIILQHVLGKKTTLKNIEAIFIEDYKETLLPYFVQSSKAKSSDEIFVKLEGIITKEGAHKLIKKKVWLLNDDFRKIVGKSSPVALIGYQLIHQKKKLGIIEEVIEQPHQVLLRITINNQEVLIPLHEQTLDKIDRNTNQVFVTLPDGLLDVYLKV